ncbi:ArsC/Spx/MgsR family protein [Flavobacterium sp. XGLA_31]|uniref:ArsC/Spx/MgsR family protein n=1 Tax=Flavobacterium sp. XGLA_31 TaxID=3447666 RepID=UPI003F379B2A
MIQILHNPRCGKSRSCLAFLNETDKKYEIINYLENPLTIEEIKVLLKKLNFKPIDLVRQKEIVWIENFKNKNLTDNEIIVALATHPILIERPIVIDCDKAVIARELDKLEGFL